MMKVVEVISARHANAFANRPARIVCLGDSVTHGCFEVFMNRFGNIDTIYDTPKGYVRLLQDELLRLFPASAVSVINSGISGDGTAGALKRFERDVSAFQPDLVTVNLGLNDCMAENADAALKAYRRNMTEIFSRIRGLGAEGMLVTPNMMCTYVDPSLPEGTLRNLAAEAAKRQNDGVLDAFVETARECAREAGFPIADAYGVWKAYARAGVDATALLSNRINHPNAAMHEVFVRKIMDCLFE